MSASTVSAGNNHGINPRIEVGIRFDKGAQHSFITLDLVQKLPLASQSTAIIYLSTFGFASVTVRHYDECQL